MTIFSGNCLRKSTSRKSLGLKAKACHPFLFLLNDRHVYTDTYGRKTMNWIKSATANLNVAQLKEWKGQIASMTRDMVIEGTREFYNAHVPEKEDGSADNTSVSHSHASNSDESQLAPTSPRQSHKAHVASQDVDNHSNEHQIYVAASFVEEATLATNPAESFDHYEHDTFVEAGASESAVDRSHTSAPNALSCDSFMPVDDQFVEHQDEWRAEDTDADVNEFEGKQRNVAANFDSQTAFGWHVESEIETETDADVEVEVDVEVDVSTELANRSSEAVLPLTDVDLQEDDQRELFSTDANGDASNDERATANPSASATLHVTQFATTSTSGLPVPVPVPVPGTSAMSRSWHQLQMPVATHNSSSQTELSLLASRSVEAQIQVGNDRLPNESESESECGARDSVYFDVDTQTEDEANRLLDALQLSVESQTDHVLFAVTPEVCHQADTQTENTLCEHNSAQTETEITSRDDCDEAHLSVESQTDHVLFAVAPEVCHQADTQTENTLCEHNSAQTETETETEITSRDDCEVHTQTDALEESDAQKVTCDSAQVQTDAIDFPGEAQQVQQAVQSDGQTQTDCQMEDAERELPVVDKPSCADAAIATDRVRCKARKVQTEVAVEVAQDDQLQLELSSLKHELQLANAERTQQASALELVYKAQAVPKLDCAVSTDATLSYPSNSLASQTDAAPRIEKKHVGVLVRVAPQTRECAVQKDAPQKTTNERASNTDAQKPKEQRSAAMQTDKTDKQCQSRPVQTDEVPLQIVQKADASVLTDGQLVEANAFFEVRNACILLQEQLNEVAGREERALLENQRLKAHLVELDQTYTISLSEVEGRERTLQSRATEFQQQCELLKAQLDSVMLQRDEAVQSGLTLQQRAQASQQAVERLQSVILVYEKEKEELISAETERFNKDAKRLETDLAMARREIAVLQDKIQKQQAEIDGSRRLSEQLYFKEKLVAQIQNEVQMRDTKLAELQSQIDKLSRVSNQTIDRTLIKSLFLSYVNTPITKRIDVIRLMCNVLQCDETEQQKAIDSERSAAGGGGWMSGLFSGSRGAPPGSNAAPGSSDQSIAAFGEMFVKFLEHETEKKPQLKLPVDHMLHRHRLPSGSSSSSHQRSSASASASTMDLDRSNFGSGLDADASRSGLNSSMSAFPTLAESPATRAAPAQTALERYNDVVAEHLQSNRAATRQSPATKDVANI